MTDKLKSLQDFYKAQAIRDPLGLATYVTTRYGKLDKFGMAQGMAGKANAKEWNKVKNVAPSIPEIPFAEPTKNMPNINLVSKKILGGVGEKGGILKDAAKELKQVKSKIDSGLA